MTGTGRQRAERAIERRGQFTILEIASEAKIDKAWATLIVTRLVQHGHLRKASKSGRGNLYELVKRIPTRPPIARVRIWRSMRMMHRFAIADLCATAEATNANARAYVEALVHAGYVRCIKKAAAARGPEGYAIFALVKDTGPLAPKRAGAGSIFDPNIADAEGGSGCGNQNISRGCAPNASAAARRPSRG